MKTGQRLCARKIGVQKTECGITSSVESAQDAASHLADTNTKIIWRSVINAEKSFSQSLFLHTKRFVTGILILGQMGILYKDCLFYPDRKSDFLCTPNGSSPMIL